MSQGADGAARYRTLFDASPVAMGELETTGLLRLLQDLRAMSAGSVAKRRRKPVSHLMPRRPR